MNLAPDCRGGGGKQSRFRGRNAVNSNTKLQEEADEDKGLPCSSRVTFIILYYIIMFVLLD
jgi:hypothetical protein